MTTHKLPTISSRKLDQRPTFGAFPLAVSFLVNATGTPLFQGCLAFAGRPLNSCLIYRSTQ